MAEVIKKMGPFKGWPASVGTHFNAVARSIVFQQLSGKAAGTIHGRFHGLYGGRPPLPSELAETSDEKLRSVGLSQAKIRIPQGSGCARRLGRGPHRDPARADGRRDCCRADAGKGDWAVDGADVHDVPSWAARCSSRSGPRNSEGNSAGVSFAKASLTGPCEEDWGEMGTIPYSCVMVPVAVCRYTGESAALIGMKLNSCSAYHALSRTKSA